MPGKSIGYGKSTRTITLIDSEPGDSIDNSAIQSMLWQESSAGTLPTPNSNTLYFVYLPPGTQVTSGGSVSCSEFCGYRETVNGFDYALILISTMPNARVARQSSTRSHRCLRASFVKPTPIPCQVKVGTTMPTAKSATSASGKPN